MFCVVFRLVSTRQSWSGAGAVVTERVDFERSLAHVSRKVGLKRGRLPAAKET